MPQTGASPSPAVGARTELAVGDQKHRGLCQEGEDVIGWALDVNYLVASCKQLGTSPCISATQSRSMGQLRQQVSLGDISRILSRSHHLFIISHAFSHAFSHVHEIPWDPMRSHEIQEEDAASADSKRPPGPAGTGRIMRAILARPLFHLRGHSGAGDSTYETNSELRPFSKRSHSLFLTVFMLTPPIETRGLLTFFFCLRCFLWVWGWVGWC